MHLTTALLGIAAIALTGCPDPGEGGDAAVLVGTWDEVPEPGEEAGFVTFRADGTYELDDGEIGTFTADAVTLTTTSSTGDVNEMPYATDGDRLIPIGLRRTGAGTGFVGEWHAEGRENEDVQSLVLEINADTTARMEFAEGAFDGTWREQSGQLITTLQIPIDNGTAPFDFRWHSVSDALGVVLFERR